MHRGFDLVTQNEVGCAMFATLINEMWMVLLPREMSILSEVIEGMQIPSLDPICTGIDRDGRADI